MRIPAQIRAFTTDDYDDVIALWRDCGLGIKRSDALPEIEKLLALPSTSFLVAEAADADLPPRIVATAIGAWDGRRGWVYRVAVKQDVRRNGIGTQIMRSVEDALRRCGATNINLRVGPDNKRAAEFYWTLGYSVQPLQFYSKNCEADAKSD